VSRPRKSLDDQLAELTRKRDQLEARRLALLAVKKDSDRKLDTRRKIIVGAAVLAHAELNSAFADQLAVLLNLAVTRDIDRSVIAHLLAGAPGAERAA
jgi:hypothetical protein